MRNEWEKKRRKEIYRERKKNERTKQRNKSIPFLFECNEFFVDWNKLNCIAFFLPFSFWVGKSSWCSISFDAKRCFWSFFLAFFYFIMRQRQLDHGFGGKFTKFSRSLKHFHQFYISVVLGFLVLCQTNYSGCVFSLQRTTTLRAQYWNYHHFSLALFFFYFFSFECANLHSITICEMEIWSTNEMNCNWSTSSMTKAHVFNKRFFTGKKQLQWMQQNWLTF